MDIDGPSSPLAPRSSLPPSSAPLPSTLATTNGASSPSRANGQPPRAVNGSAGGADALALDDVNPDVGADGELETMQRRRRAKMRGTIANDVPRVRDALGEQITESFETFLKT